MVMPNSLFQEHEKWLYTWVSPDGQYQNQIDYILCSQRWRSSIESAKTRLRANCGSHHELHIAEFRLKLEKVGETSRPFRYDLNQIPYDYTVEVRNKFKGLDLIDRVPDDLWNEVRDIIQQTGDQDHPHRKEMQKSKMVVWGDLTNSWEKKRIKRQRRKGKIYPFECRVPKNSRRDKKACLSDKCKEIEENNRMGKTRDHLKKIRDTKRTFHAKMDSIKDRNGMT